jgi:hypothetical protein
LSFVVAGLVLAGFGEKKSSKLKPLHLGSLFFGNDEKDDKEAVPVMLKPAATRLVRFIKDRRSIILFLKLFKLKKMHKAI